jgi:hypothetical protein
MHLSGSPFLIPSHGTVGMEGPGRQGKTLLCRDADPPKIFAPANIALNFTKKKSIK